MDDDYFRGLWARIERRAAEREIAVRDPWREFYRAVMSVHVIVRDPDGVHRCRCGSVAEVCHAWRSARRTGLVGRAEVTWGPDSRDQTDQVPDGWVDSGGGPGWVPLGPASGLDP